MVHSYASCNILNLCGEGPLPIRSTKYGDQARDLRLFAAIGFRVKTGSLIQIPPTEGLYESPPRPWRSHTQRSMTDPVVLPADPRGSVLLDQRAIDAIYYSDSDPDGETHNTKPRTWLLDSYIFDGQDMPPASASGNAAWNKAIYDMKIPAGRNPYLGIDWYITATDFTIFTGMIWTSSQGWTPAGKGVSLGCMPKASLSFEFSGYVTGTQDTIFQWPGDPDHRPSDARLYLNAGSDRCPLISGPYPYYCWSTPGYRYLLPNGIAPPPCPPEACLNQDYQFVGPEYEDEWTTIEAGARLKTDYVDGEAPIWGYDVWSDAYKNVGWLDMEVSLVPICSLNT